MRLAHALCSCAGQHTVVTRAHPPLFPPAAVRKALLARGWDLAWIDGVTGEIMKRKLTASVSEIEAAVSPSPARIAPAGCPAVRRWGKAALRDRE